MIKLLIELHDHADVVHDEFRSEFDNQSTIKHLEARINLKWHIDIEDQTLFLENGQRIMELGRKALLSCGIEDGCKVIVKHSRRTSWKAFMANFEMAQQASSEKKIFLMEESVEQAISHLMPVLKANFLITFPKFEEAYYRFRALFPRPLDPELRPVDLDVVRCFERSLVDNAECSTLSCVKNNRREIAVQCGLICQVSRCGISVMKYFVKEYTRSVNWQHPDIREIFVYKLLELIGVGPTVHFIPSIDSSSLKLYIAIQKIPGFRRADTEDFEISNEVWAQRDLLRRVLFVNDLHSKNFGVNAHGQLSIIDFQIKGYVDPEMVHKYFNGYKSWKGSTDFRIQVATSCVQSWNLLDNLEKANTAISIQKALLKEHSIGFQPSQDFEDYFLRVKNNVSALIEYLRQN